MSQRVRSGIFIAIIGIGIVAVGFFVLNRLVRQSLAPLPEPTPLPSQKELVVVATHNIQLGSVLKTEDLRTVEMPIELLPPDAIRDLETAVGRFSKVDLVSGEMVMNHHLADPTNVSHDVGFIIDDAQVLMAFPASDLMSSLSIIQRGDLVDIFVTMSQEVRVVPEGEEDLVVAEGEEEPTEVRTLTFDAMQRVEITALVVDIITEDQGTVAVPLNTQGEQPPQPTPKPSDVKIKAYLLALLPQDALVLKYLKDSGATFDMVLRAPTSDQLFDLSTVTSDYLIDRFELELPK